jgi:hypothetical protein
MHESHFQVRKINASKLARIQICATASFSAITFALSNVCIHQLRLASKRTLTHVSIHTRLSHAYTHICVHTCIRSRTPSGNYEYLHNDMCSFILYGACESIQTCMCQRTLVWTHSHTNEHLSVSGIYALLHSYHMHCIKSRNIKFSCYTPCRPEFTPPVRTNVTDGIIVCVARRFAFRRIG